MIKLKDSFNISFNKNEIIAFIDIKSDNINLLEDIFINRNYYTAQGAKENNKDNNQDSIPLRTGFILKPGFFFKNYRINEYISFLISVNEMEIKIETIKELFKQFRLENFLYKKPSQINKFRLVEIELLINLMIFDIIIINVSLFNGLSFEKQFDLIKYFKYFKKNKYIIIEGVDYPTGLFLFDRIIISENGHITHDSDIIPYLKKFTGVTEFVKGADFNSIQNTSIFDLMN